VDEDIQDIWSEKMSRAAARVDVFRRQWRGSEANGYLDSGYLDETGHTLDVRGLRCNDDERWRHRSARQRMNVDLEWGMAPFFSERLNHGWGAIGQSVAELLLTSGLDFLGGNEICRLAQCNRSLGGSGVHTTVPRVGEVERAVRYKHQFDRPTRGITAPLEMFRSESCPEGVKVSLLEDMLKSHAGYGDRETNIDDGDATTPPEKFFIFTSEHARNVQALKTDSEHLSTYGKYSLAAIIDLGQTTRIVCRQSGWFVPCCMRHGSYL
jgi:hypothetical protein